MSKTFSSAFFATFCLFFVCLANGRSRDGTASSPEYEDWDCTKCTSTSGYSYCHWDEAVNGRFHMCLPDVSDGFNQPCGAFPDRDMVVHKCDQCPSDCPYAFDYIGGPQSECCCEELTLAPDAGRCEGLYATCWSPPCDDYLTETCSDNIMNQGEDDVDCGGPCDPCEPEATTSKPKGNNDVTWNRKVCCKEGIGNWKFCKLQRFMDDDHGDVCRHNGWPENRNWRCPKGCFKVWDGPTNGHADKPFCVGKDKKACRV